MTLVRIPAHLFSPEDTTAEVACKSYLRDAISRMYKDLGEAFEALKYTGDRSELYRCLLGYSNFFKKISLMFRALKHSGTVSEVGAALEDIQRKNDRFVLSADSLAYSFEKSKNRIKPSLNIETALRFYKDYNLLYPKVLSRKRERVSYREVDRLIRIYLIRASIRHLDAEVAGGILTLRSKHFVFRLALCGDIKNPEWKLFDVNRKNKEVFLTCLPSDIGKLDYFTGLYLSLERAKEVYSKFTSDAFLGALVKGTPKSFVINYISEFRVLVKEERLVAVFTYKNTTICFCSSIVERYEQETENILRGIDDRIRFSISSKIVLGKERFHTLVELTEYIYKEKEEKAFYSLFYGYKAIRNYRREEFGPKNAFVQKDRRFLCIKLNGIREVGSTYHLDVEVFSGLVVRNNCISFISLFFCNINHLCLTNDSEHRERAGASVVSLENLKLFLKSNLELIFVIFDIVLLNKSYVVLLGDNRLKIHLEDQAITVARESGHFLTNDGRVISNITGIRNFLEYTVLARKLRDIAGVKTEVENGVLHVSFKEFKFKICFVNKAKVISDNRAFVKMMERGDIPSFLVNFYYIYFHKMYPAFVSRYYMIFNFKMLFKDQVILKIKDMDAFFVKKSYFTTSSFKLPSFSYYYLECKPENTSFFDDLRRIYLKERFLALSDALRREFKADWEEFRVCVHLNKKMVFSLEDGRFHVEVQGHMLQPNTIKRLVDVFYEEEDLVGSFIKLLHEI